MTEITEAIDGHWKAKQTGHRPHLGASQIGEECERKLVYSFRHAIPVVHEGRMLRLFARGHIEESRFFNYLRDIGFEVREYAERLLYHSHSDSYFTQAWEEPDYNGTDVTSNPLHVEAAKAAGIKIKQWNFKEFGGHFSGSTDGEAQLTKFSLRKFLNINVGQRFLLECKTYNTKNFVALIKEQLGIVKFAPKHYAQVQIYMHEMKLEFCLYLAVNKNDDDLHTEIIQYNEQHALEFLNKAQRVIVARQLPKRVSDYAGNTKCMFCEYKGPCHYNTELTKHCRTCKHVVPVDEARFHCSRFNALIPLDVERIGCDSYEVITD